jgi:hypothetical protein
LDNVWFSLSGKVNSQTTYVSIGKSPCISWSFLYIALSGSD